MLTFVKYDETDLYLCQGTDAASARVGFLFQHSPDTPPTFELNAQSWLDPSHKGYFAFFPPAVRSDWRAFAATLRAKFEATNGAQFGWFTAAGEVVELAIVKAEDTGAAFVFQPFSLTFGSIVLSLQAGPSRKERTPVSFDDATNSVRFSNENDVIQLVTQPPGEKKGGTYTSGSSCLALPLDDKADHAHAGCVNADFQFGVSDLATFEAGFMYFAPGGGNGLTALSYPLLRAPGGASAPLNFSGWFDATLPFDDVRSYFRCSDAIVGSYFTTANGKAIALKTNNGSDVGSVSRLAFTNRPSQSTSESGKYAYLTPAGSFTLQIDGNPSATAAELLCGTTGTEYLNTLLPSDSLFMKTGQPAFRKTTASDKWDVPPQFLDSMNGNVTTSWVQLVTTQGSYVSQPQDAPLYQQAGTTKIPSTSLSVYLLHFYPLDAWSSGGKAGPLVPMVPYAGVNVADFTAYGEMETQALNPTRKNKLTLAPASSSSAGVAPAAVAAEGPPEHWVMTPQGLLAGLDSNNVWVSTRIGLSSAPDGTPRILQFENMGDAIRKALQQNQIFLVISSLTAPDNSKLFDFDDAVDIAGWPFSLSPAGTRDVNGVPPIVILKFYPGQSISSLVGDLSLWSQAETFNTSSGFTAADAQKYIQGVIANAGNPEPGSLKSNFVQVVNDPNFSGMLVLNANLQLNSLPAAIKAVTGGMNKPGTNPPQSNIDAFRVHHVGVAINDTDPNIATPSLAQSAFFALIDYDVSSSKVAAPSGGIAFDYGFEVEYLHALFANAALVNFDCRINLTVNKLFGAAVSDGSDNIIVISGSYQAHSTSGDSGTSGEGLYSFVAEKPYTYKFTSSGLLETIKLTKLQFTFQQETPSTNTPNTSHLQAAFGIWGSMTFKQLSSLDVFSFQQLTFNDLGISVSFDLTVPPNAPPATSNLLVSFNPGNLRVDVSNSPAKTSTGSMLNMLPFKLKSFFYNEYPDRQTIEDLQYISLGSIPLDTGFSLTKQFSYALAFDLDLGTLGALVGSLEAFKFGFLVGWLEPTKELPDPLQIAFGVQLPQADGKLEIKIQGILDLLIQEFKLAYVTLPDGSSKMLVLMLHNLSIELFGRRLPPGKAELDLAIFAPSDGAAHIGWIAAYNNEPKQLAAGGGGGEGEGGSSAFELMYLGLGQRTGPDPEHPPANFHDFLKFMTGAYWTAIENNEYASVYHPDGQWLALTHFQVLQKITFGFILYDVTPLYSLSLSVKDAFDFEITYTKINDSIGLFHAELTLPDNLRKFQVGAASVTLPTLKVSVYTNGNWKLDLGFPDGDDWSGCFQVQAMAGPVPVTGSGGFYLESLSSATSKIFSGGPYQSIVGFGFAARLGVGKDFTSGPLKAGVSVTFFGILQGAAGYLASGGAENILSQPDALSLQGQFGIIGELYGTLDFVIIKASVNVRLEASIGIVLLYEFNTPNDGSVLLYIEASVSVSVSVEIDFVLFSVTISFSFDASFRFQWQLAGSSSTQSPALEEASRMVLAGSAVLTAGSDPIPLIRGFSAALPLWYLPEATVTFAPGGGTGTPWLVSSLGAEYIKVDVPGPAVDYSSFKAFEQVTTQLATWAICHALPSFSWNSPITEAQLAALDSPADPTKPNPLVGWIDYPSLLAQLAVFASSTVTVPTASSGTLYAAVFPMLPFFKLKTTGRQGGDFDFLFSSKNGVPPTYIEEVDAYFNQLFVNRSGASAATLTSTLLAPADTSVPLIQEIFLNYFTGLIRGAVHQLLVAIQKPGAVSPMPLDELVSNAVGMGLFASLSGQMSSSFRGGVRLPNSTVVPFTLPDGSSPQETNALYALLWQQIPAGPAGEYHVVLTNGDAAQSWITPKVDWCLETEWLKPYLSVSPSSIDAPSAPVQLPFTNCGPQAFAFANPVAWTRPAQPAVQLCAFPGALARLQSRAADINVQVESRRTGAAYLAGGTVVPAGSFSWATQVTLRITRIPDGNGGTLPDVFSLAGASQSDQQLIEQILQGPVSSIDKIQILYQKEAGASGLVSDDVITTNPDGTRKTGVFALRTNTTTVSSPPPSPFLMLFAGEAPSTVPVGADLLDAPGFLRIIQQAAVTNAAGYYLRYWTNEGKSLPAELFANGPAPLTILITFQAPGGAPAVIHPYYNAILFDNTFDPSRTYYAETTDENMKMQYAAVAAGTMGALLQRSENASVAGSKPLQHLHALYSLITYQIAQTAGFKQSNLSAPIQPQKEKSDGTVSSYRVFAPLYNVAIKKKDAAIPNRYAGIGAAVTINFFQNDAFGNQMPSPLQLTKVSNLYFDPIIPLDQWQGVSSSYDFSGTTAGSFKVTLTPDAAAFAKLTQHQVDSAFAAWTAIHDQITACGVSFVIETNLALASDGSLVEVTLDAAQTAQIRAMAQGMVSYLGQYPLPPVFNVPAVPLTLTVSGPGALPPAFEISVLFQIRRDPQYLSPMIKDPSGNVTFLAAEVASTSVASTVGTVQIGDFAAAFVRSFPQLSLAVGLNGASSSTTAVVSSVAKKRLALQGAGVAADGSSSGSRNQPLWAVQKPLLDITIGGANAGPFFSSPKPLDNTLNSATVDLPWSESLGKVLPPGTTWPSQQLFSDIDLDRLNSVFFQAVDNFLAPASAAQAFENANTKAAYVAVAEGRETLANLYSTNEIDWLFADANGNPSPYTGSGTQLADARTAFGQQMRAALATAYTTDTVVQYDVTWKSLPAGIDDRYALYGTIVPPDPLTAKGYTISVPTVPISPSGQSTLTFLFGVPDVQDVGHVTMSLAFNVTHLEIFLVPAGQVPEGQARPSMWLQLVNPYATLPPIGTDIDIPLVFREYPTPPTIVSQSAEKGADLPSPPASGNQLVDAAAWHFTYAYQVQLTSHDVINTSVTYNTDLRPSSSGGGSSPQNAAALAAGEVRYTLFEALARFAATYAVIQPVLSKPGSPNWADAAGVFQGLVTDVVNNSTWNPNPLRAAAVGTLLNITDKYTITDAAGTGTDKRTITLSWDAHESSFPQATLSVEALDPATQQPYLHQTPGRKGNVVTDTYTPDPPLHHDWVMHQVEVHNLNVLSAENALAGMQVERNLIGFPENAPQWFSRSEFVYKTPIVRATQPITPYIDNPDPIDIAKLPHQGIGSGCPSAPAGAASLCQRIYTLMDNLLADESTQAALKNAMAAVGDDSGTARRVKVACSFEYPVGPVRPLIPIALARSFLIDGAVPQQLSDFSSAFATAIATWAASNDISFGSGAQAGAQFIFDITLFAELSGVNTPLLRLSNLQLDLSDVAP